MSGGAGSDAAAAAAARCAALRSVRACLTWRAPACRLACRRSGSGDGSSSTAVEAFSAPLAGPVNSSGTSPVVVARRRGTAPARLAPNSGSAGSRSAAQWEQDCSALLSIGDRLGALQLPGPSSGIVRCFIRRSSNLLGVATLYELRLESTDELLAVAHKRLGSAASCFDISLAASPGGWGGSGCSTPSSSPSVNGGGSGSSAGPGPAGGIGGSIGGEPQRQLLVGKVRGALRGRPRTGPGCRVEA